MLHKSSSRADEPFISVNCGSLRSEQFEKVLFGEEDHSGVEIKVEKGLLEKADGGVLFLDEVADLPIDIQARMVHLLQDQSFKRVVGDTDISVDLRFIAATRNNLEQLIRLDRFREDLYYRLNVVPIHIPPLSERAKDIPVLADELMEKTARKHGFTPLQFSQSARLALQEYHWPGNIRQLGNVIEWLLIMGAKEEQRAHMKGWEGSVIHAEALPPEITSEAPGILALDKGDEIMQQPLREAREMFEREYISIHLNRFGGNVSRTADFIGMERSALHRKMKNLKLQPNNDNAKAS